MKELEKIIARVLNLDEKLIRDELCAENCEEWTSLAHMNLILEIEEFYNVTFDTLETMELDSVANIKKILVSKGVNLSE